MRTQPAACLQPLSPWRRLAAVVSALQLLGLCAASAASSAADQNWPHWRGPLGIGVAPSANPPVTWSETSNVKWKVKIPGRGSATPIIWDNQVFVQTAVPTGKKVEPPAEQAAPQSPAPDPAAQEQSGQTGQPGQAGQPGRRRGGGGGGFGRGEKPTEFHQFVLQCLDRQTGKVLWQQAAREEVPHEGHHRSDGTFASSSPVTDGQHIFAYFGSRGLHCYDMAGKQQWSQDFGDMRVANTFGEGSSPTLYKDTLVINWDHEGDDFIVALDKRTGKELWRQSRDERTSWSTPLIVEHEGKPQVVVNATGKIRSYDLANGKLIWECAGLTPNAIPSPVFGNGIVYCTSGFRGSALLAIRLGRTGDLTDSDAIVWKHNKSTPYVPSPLLYSDKLYFFASNNEMLSCFDAKSGQALIDAERLEGIKGVYASPVGAGGRVYLVGRNGGTVVVKPSDKLEVLATNQLEERFDASPAVVGNELFLRGREYLYCLAQK
jgi:outer membrane protein assembly factor BamB